MGEGSVNLTDLPNEVLVHIVSFLDARSILHLHTVCRRLQALTSDPINWSAISWSASNRIKDLDGLKSALRLSKSALKRLSLTCFGGSLHISKCLDQVLRCQNLERVSLHQVGHTEKQVVKLLGSLPVLEYLHLDHVDTTFFKTITTSGHKHLRTLSLSLRDFSGHYIEVWSREGYCPPDLRIAQDSYIFNRDRIQSILSFPPSQKHHAFLSLYHLRTTEDIIPPHPYLQFRFTPNPTLPIMHPLRLVLTADVPGSSDYSTADYNFYCKDMKGNVQFRDICMKLTILRLHIVPPGLLGKLAGVLPNLVHLDVSSSKGGVLSNLKELVAIRNNCPKLRVLNLFEIERRGVESVEKLWKILAVMANLRVLFVSIDLIVEKSETPDLATTTPFPMPALTAIIIRGPSQLAHSSNGLQFNLDKSLSFLARMPSLKAFKFENMPPASVYHGFTRLLQASPALTHLYISRTPGNKLTLPAQASCYANLEQMFLDCEDFILHEDLAVALAQSRMLYLLVLKVAHCDTTGLVELVNGPNSLSVFHVVVSSEMGLKSNQKAGLFAKSLRESAKKQGKMIDFSMKTSKVPNGEVEELKWFPYE